MALNDNPAGSSKRMCVACQTDVTGKRALAVKEDRIIRIIRAVKRSLGVAQNNQLFVCETCLPKHNERRRSFEKTLLFASVLAGLMLVLLILVPMLSGRFEAWAILSGFIVAVFVVMVPIIFKYVPSVEGFSATVPYTAQMRMAASAPAQAPPSPLPVRPAPAPAPERAAPPVKAERTAPARSPPKAKEKDAKKSRKK